MVFIPRAMVSRLHRFHRQFAVFSRHRNQLAAGKFFRRAAFVHIYMGAFGTNDGMIGISESLQTQAISRCAVENEEHFNIFAQLFFKVALRGMCICVIPVSDYMSLVGRADRLKYIGVDASIIVTGKTASGFHEFNNLADEQKVGGATLFFELMTSNQRVLDSANYVTLWLHILLEVDLWQSDNVIVRTRI
jgi:hypothetical protein